ncbi:hypothetical protein KIN20_035998 [Parelaphostrongylus tenuis]|uniref:Uncharacterized protein n=1 Tax=Parelaphostrongylus tenuis TaxID=148309 RepID=A0AAD5RCH9_PARTN|nr:hypothetical protein KIN20_035998 [Parelaphostrongylus tenuis]
MSSAQILEECAIGRCFYFLAGLVFFFYFLYVYQAQSNEYAIVRAELETQLQKIQDLKVDFVSAKAENERLSALENELKNEKDKLTKDFETCSGTLRSCKLNSENLQSEKRTLEEQSRNKDVSYESLQQKNEELTKTIEHLKKSSSEQEVIVDQLKATIQKLEAEVDRLKSGTTDRGSIFVANQSGTTTIGFTQTGTTSATKRSDEVDHGEREIIDDKQVGQAPPPVIHEDRSQTVKQTADVRDVVKDEHEPDAPPQRPGDRVKLAVAADEQRNKDEKPVVKDGNYDAVEEDADDDLQV